MSAPPYRTALITGASSGIGRGLAVHFAKKGVRVFAAARRADRLKELEEEAKALGGALEAVTLDVNDAAAVVKRIEALDAQCGGLDLVIANAGVSAETYGKRLRWEDVEKVIQTNVIGAAATLTAAVPKMVERQRGHLVGVSSLADFRGLPRFGAYSASKAFLTTFLESLRVDLRPLGIRVTTLKPGFVKTEMTQKATFRMPFLQELDAAINGMAKAIERGATEYAFPPPLVAMSRLGSVIPNAIWDKSARRFV